MNTQTTAQNDEVRSESAVSSKMKQALETVALQTSTGLVLGALAGIVLARTGATGARRSLAGLGAGIGLGSAWTRTSMDIATLLQDED